MAFRSTYSYDEGGVLRSWGIGEGSAGWFGGSIWGSYSIIEGMFPQGGTTVPDVISEEPQTWEELERSDPELFEPILETRPGRTPDPYPQDVSDAETPEDEQVPTWTDWGQDLVGGLIGDWISGQSGGGQPINIAPQVPLGPSTPANQAATAAAMNDCDGMQWSGGTPPKGYKVVNSCGVGVLRKVRRRRRRRMLTAGDKADIASIISMAGKGQLAASLINRSTH